MNNSNTGILRTTAAQEMMSGNKTTNGSIIFPAEWEPHKMTFMVWPASDKIWKNILKDVRDDIADIATAIAKYEPVVVLVHPDQVPSAEELLQDSNIEIVKMEVNDLWARDTLPVFTFRDKDALGIDFNFNGWGNRQDHSYDSLLARQIMEKYEVSYVKSSLVAEAGALETDGAGTLLVTESSIVNNNRNPGKSKLEIERELKRTLGVEKIIWFPGVRDKDVTDAHVDSLVRFLRPGIVLLNRPAPGSTPDEWSRSSDQAKSILEKETDAKGNKFTIIEIHEPDPDEVETIGEDEDFLSSYVNFYITNGAVIVPMFGDKGADEKAQSILKEYFPERDIVPVSIKALASGGGGIHCATHELPSLSSSPRVVAGANLGLILAASVLGIFTVFSFRFISSS